MLVRITIMKGVMDIMMRSPIKMMWTVVPKAMDNGKVLKVNFFDVEQRFSEGKGGMNNKVECYWSES